MKGEAGMTPTELKVLLEKATNGTRPPPLPASGTYTAEQVAAFESEHGHDIRLDCYPEYGCLVQSAAANAIFDLAPKLLALWEAAQDHDRTHPSRDMALDRTEAPLRAALNALEGVKPE